MKRTLAVGFLILIVCHVGVATAQDPKFVDKLVATRLQLKIDGERMTGGGADLLQSALDGAQYVLIGEDHGTSEIPAFTRAVCAILGPQGFHTMAVEAGPMAAAIVRDGLGVTTDESRSQRRKRNTRTVSHFSTSRKSWIWSRAAHGRGRLRHSIFGD